MRVSVIGGTLLIEAAGAIGAGATARLRDHIDRAREGDRQIVLDLSAVTQLAKDAIDMLRAEWRTIGDRRLRVVAPVDSEVAAALKRAGLRRFAVHGSLSGALTQAADAD